MLSNDKYFLHPMNLIKYKIKIEYDGLNYAGWQKQPNAKTIQETIENALFKYCREKVKVLGCSRTDAKVHAMAQIAHFEISKDRSVDSILDGLNFYLKDEKIAIKNVEKVDNLFHSRRCAKGKIYLYKIINRKVPPVLEKDKVWHVKHTIDIDKLKQQSQKLLGCHNFSAFRGKNCQSKKPIRTLNNIIIDKKKDIITIRFVAKSFLQYQIRIMTSVLIDVATGRNIDINWMLKQKDRSTYHKIAPAYGLYLEKIFYSDKIGMFQSLNNKIPLSL